MGDNHLDHQPLKRRQPGLLRPAPCRRRNAAQLSKQGLFAAGDGGSDANVDGLAYQQDTGNRTCGDALWIASGTDV